MAGLFSMPPSSRSGTRPISEYLRSEQTVTLYVGPQREKWVLNEKLLCDRAPHFQAAFQGNFKEATTKEMELPEEDANAFAKLVDWVYCDKLECGNRGPIADEARREMHVMQWCMLWVLADKFQIPQLKSQTIERLKSCLMRCTAAEFSEEAVFAAYDQTPQGSTLRLTLTDWACKTFMGTPGTSAESFDIEKWSRVTSSHAEFHLDVMKEIRAQTGVGWMASGPGGVRYDPALGRLGRHLGTSIMNRESTPEIEQAKIWGLERVFRR